MYLMKNLSKLTGNNTNAPRVDFKGRGHQVKKLLDEMEIMNAQAMAQLSQPAKFTQQVTSAMKKLNIF